MATKRLFRSETSKIFAGVLGGLGEYLDVDPVLLRLFYLAVTIFTGIVPGVIVYILAIFIVPVAPKSSVVYEAQAAGASDSGATPTGSSQ